MYVLVPYDCAEYRGLKAEMEESVGVMVTTVRVVTRLEPVEIGQLSELLISVVDDGASIGFLPPVERAEAEAYWSGVLEPGVVLVLAEQMERIVGSVQLQLAAKANARHRAEVAKLMVDPACRRQGIGRLLMERLEDEARRDGRRLLILDTRDGDPSNALYQAMGYQEAGRIPRYARSASGSLDGTVFYFKELG